MLSILNGCQQEEHVLPHTSGDEIVFGTATSWTNTGFTRTEYSGKDQNDESLSATSSEHERIDWVSSNDRIRIVCEQAKEGHQADYVFDGAVTSDGKKSAGKVKPVQEKGLRWGTGAHRFYALYPAPGTTSNYGFSTCKTVPEEGAAARVAAAEGKAVFTGTLPAVQEAVKVDGTDKVVYKANMNYAFMYAAQYVAAESSGLVSLGFRPLVTAFEFTLCGMSDDLIDANLTGVELSSSSTTLNGTFTATVEATAAHPEGGSPVIAITSSQEEAACRKVTLTLPDGGVKLTADKPVQFTLFALPVDQTDLTLTLRFGNGTLTRSLPLKNNDDFIVAAGGTKMYVTNLAVPGRVYFYDMTPIANITISGPDALEEIARSVRVNTEKDRTDGWQGDDRQNKKTPWKFMYVRGSKAQPVKGTLVTGNSDFSANAPEWFNSVSGGQGDGLNNNVTLKTGGGYTLDMDWTLSPSAKAMVDVLQANNLGSAPIDLSTRDFLTGTTLPTAETANCYIVDGYGQFRIPLVYGNAWKNGDNAAAYSLADEYFDPSRVLTRLVNADGQPIGSPFILEDPSLSQSGTPCAEVLWQDVPEGFEIIRDENIPVSATRPSGNAAVPCGYLEFSISQDDIKPGNVVIGLKDGNGKVLWSWHIWIRADIPGSESGRLRTIPAKYTTWPGDPNEQKDVDFLSENLGWVPPITYPETYVSQNSIWVVVVSTEANQVIGSFKVTQQSYYKNPSVGYRYSQPYYQWGRKDPMPPSDGGSYNKTCTGVSSFSPGSNSNNYGWGYAEGGDGSNGYLGWMVRNPALLFFDEGNYETYPSYGNLWDMDNNPYVYSRELYVVKTVYDPSPRGFSVPFPYAFDGIVADGSSASSSSDIYGQHYQAGAYDGNAEWPSSWMFTTQMSASASTFALPLPDTGYRQGQSLSMWDNSGYYWTSDPVYYGNAGIALMTSQNWIRVMNEEVRHSAFPVRPMLEPVRGIAGIHATPTEVHDYPFTGPRYNQDWD